MPQCINCCNWEPRKTSPTMAKLGFAVCAVKSLSPGHTFSATFERECNGFSTSDVPTIEARLKYRKQQQEKS